MINNFFNTATALFANVTDGLDGMQQIYTTNLEEDIAELSFNAVKYASIALVVLLIIAWATINKHEKFKFPLFIAIASIITLTTLTLIGSTVYLNTTSDSGGPVHWHADIEIWACGNELELRDPTGFSNKIGTSTLHEHDDHRIHLEGVVVDEKVDASLGKFMHVTGGAITDSAMVVPVNPDLAKLYEDEVDGDGEAAPTPSDVAKYVVESGDEGKFAKFVNGGDCGGQAAEVQVFAYKLDKEADTYTQTKIEHPAEYVIRDEPNVPPGDCIIFEFDKPKEKTNKLCEQYGVRDIDRCEEFGVLPEEREVCTLKQNEYDANINYDVVEPVDPDPTSQPEVQGIQTYEEFLEDIY